jgi:hypothetical protein
MGYRASMRHLLLIVAVVMFLCTLNLINVHKDVLTSLIPMVVGIVAIILLFSKEFKQE